MREHLTACARCSRRDSDIRRALLLVKNLPPVKVADDFGDRLRARLASEAADPAPAAAPLPRATFQHGPLKWSAAAALVAIVAVQAWPSAESANDSPTRLPAVVASVPVEGQADESAPAFMASMSTGIPMWPALMLAEEGPLRFAATGMQNLSWDGSSRPND